MFKYEFPYFRTHARVPRKTYSVVCDMMHALNKTRKPDIGKFRLIDEKPSKKEVVGSSQRPFHSAQDKKESTEPPKSER